MLRIGEFSKMAKTTIKTLRYYYDEGLLIAEAVDKFTGYRLYTTSQLFEVHKIQSLRQIGVSIGEIKLVLSGTVLMKDILEKRKSENFMNYQAIIKELPECVVYSKEVVIPGYESYFEDIKFKKLEAVSVVSVMHKGPYSRLSDSNFKKVNKEKSGRRTYDRLPLKHYAAQGSGTVEFKE